MGISEFFSSSSLLLLLPTSTPRPPSLTPSLVFECVANMMMSPTPLFPRSYGGAQLF